MSVAITASANRFSMNGVIFKDYINLNQVLLISLCKDRYYERFDILFIFTLGRRNASYTDETLLRVGPFANKYLERAEELVARLLLEEGKVFYIDEEILGKPMDEAAQDEIRGEENDFASQAKTVAVETAKKMKAEGLPVEVICKVLGLSELEISGVK
ncbi:MAG: hypothetical protein LBB36_07150 [Fibromonadaceae bacterium]|jgi:hypothetical protein|nr:hypothetical protein [Fibromonadaceae bacterium]